MRLSLLYVAVFGASLLQWSGCVSKTALWTPFGIGAAGRTSTFDGNLVVVVADRRKDAGPLDQLTAEISARFAGYFLKASITTVPASEFRSTANPGAVVVRLQVLEYRAGIGGEHSVADFIVDGRSSRDLLRKGNWNGVVALGVSVIDYRNNRERRSVKNIGCAVPASSASPRARREALSKACGRTMAKTLDFVESSLSMRSEQLVDS